MTTDVSIQQLEWAINYWRQLYPAARDTMTLCPQAAMLAEVYARMIVLKQTNVQLDSLRPETREVLVSAMAQAPTGLKWQAAA